MNSLHLAMPFLMVFFPILPESMPLSLSPWFKTKLFGVGIISVLCSLHSALHKALVVVSTYILTCSSLSSISLFLSLPSPSKSELLCSQPTCMNHSSISRRGNPLHQPAGPTSFLSHCWVGRSPLHNHNKAQCVLSTPLSSLRTPLGPHLSHHLPLL